MENAKRRLSGLLVRGFNRKVKEKVTRIKPTSSQHFKPTSSQKSQAGAFPSELLPFKQEALNVFRSFFPRFCANVIGGVFFYFAITEQNNSREKRQFIAEGLREADRALMEHQFNDCRILAFFAKQVAGVDIGDMLRSREAYRAAALKIAVCYELHLLHPKPSGLSSGLLSSEGEHVLMVLPDIDVITLKEVEISRNRIMTLFGGIFHYATEMISVEEGASKRTKGWNQLTKEKKTTISSCEPSLVVFLAIAIPMTHAIVGSLEVGSPLVHVVNPRMVDQFHEGLRSIRSGAPPMQGQYIPDSTDSEWVSSEMRARKRELRARERAKT